MSFADDSASGIKMIRGRRPPMRRPRFSCLALVAALALSGCSYGDTVLDWATGTTAATNTAAADTTIANKPPATDANAQPTVSASQPPPASGGAAAAAPGTLLAQKIQAVRADAGQFQGSVERLQADFAATRQSLGNNASSYSNIIAGVNTRLQAGTTAGNPDLVAQWGQAQSLLDKTNNSVAHLIGISNEAANDSSFGTFVLTEIRAALDLRGVAESDRDVLRQLEVQTNVALTQVDQLHTAVTGEIAHQNAYVAGERNNLTALALAIQDGRASGPSVASRPAAPAGGGAAAAPNAVAPRSAAPSRASAAPAAAGASDRPLVVIRFDQPNVDYEEPLYKAVNSALQRKPNATFTVQAVAPKANNAAEVAVNTTASRDNATKVLRSLTAMGMPADRLSLSATMSPDIQGSEVRIFVR